MATATDAPAPKVLGVARRTFGMALLLLVVVLWTASNFLGSVRPQFVPSADKALVGLYNRRIDSNICILNRPFSPIKPIPSPSS
jgi:hypothetical protein